MKFWKINLLVFVFCSLVFGPPSHAMTSESYAIPSLTISSGGSASMESENYRMQDIKGQAVTGYSSSDSYGMGLGGMYGEVPMVMPAPEVWSEDPHVRNLRIRRSGSDIVVEWNKEPDTYTGSFYVFRRVGAFENLPTNWNRGIDVGNNVSYTDAGQVGDGDDQVYYRVLSTSEKNALVNKVAVGKVNVALEASGLKLVTCPFNDGKVSFVFPGQMADGVSYKLYPRSGSGLDVVTVTRAGVSGQDFNVVPTVGFWIRNESANSVVITFCGSLEAPYQKDLASLDLTGNPLPASLASSGLGGESGDTLYHQSGRGLNPLVKTTTWPAYTLSVGEGFWYRKSAERARYWDVNILGLSAQIKSR